MRASFRRLGIRLKPVLIFVLPHSIHHRLPCSQDGLVYFQPSRRHIQGPVAPQRWEFYHLPPQRPTEFLRDSSYWSLLPFYNDSGPIHTGRSNQATVAVSLLLHHCSVGIFQSWSNHSHLIIVLCQADPSIRDASPSSPAPSSLLTTCPILSVSQYTRILPLL